MHDTDEEGGFVREDAGFRSWITPDGSAGPTGEAGFKAEAGRYHLYVALICPWASRTLMTRTLKGLENLVSVTVVDPRLTDKVWRFGGYSRSYPGAEADPLYQFEYVYELYLRARPDYSGQVTVPVLWDKKTQTIVNNESSEIIRMFNSGFGDLADNRMDLYPVHLRAEIDTINRRLYHRFNNGVYRAGFATTQASHERAVKDVFDSMEFIEQQLEGRHYLAGNRFTEADIRAFVTLIRFDLAYYSLFKTNLKRAQDVIVHWPYGRTTVGIDVHIKDLEAIFVFAPDNRIQEHPIRIADGKWTAVVGILEGTFSEPMPISDGTRIQPTGKPYRLMMATVGRWNNGVLQEVWLFWGNHAFMKQTGLAE